MFWWPKTTHKSTLSYEPKTPKINSISLPDERYTPITYQTKYTEKSSTRNSFLRRLSTSGTTPLKDSSWDAIHPQGKPKSSRTKTILTPAREVEAPRPIRPHPSQGPFVPITEQLDNPSRGALAPVGVPSAAFLEERVRRERMSVADPRAPTEYISNHEYQDIMKKRAEKVGAKFYMAPSKAWMQDQDEQVRSQAPSAPPMKVMGPKVEDHGDVAELKPVPVVGTGPDDMVKAPPAPNQPLKSALKKTPSIKKQAVEPLIKPREYGDTKAYYSENDMDKKKPISKPFRVTKAFSKAYLEEQQEKLKESMMQQAWHQHSRSTPAAPPPVTHFRPPPFQHSNSSGSPDESVLHQEYSRNRRPSNSDVPRPKPSNYMPAYIKDSQLQQQPPQWPAVVEPHLEWPLIEYARRRHLQHPLVYFDAGFNPRESGYDVCTVIRGHRKCLTAEERNLIISTERIVITNDTLKYWRVVIIPNPSTRTIRVIDVFRAIYDTYAQPVTKQEVETFGFEYIQRCDHAFAQRCKDAPEPTHWQERQGLRRIDLLRGRRIFRGLVHHRDAPHHHFELLFDRGD